MERQNRYMKKYRRTIGFCSAIEKDDHGYSISDFLRVDYNSRTGSVSSRNCLQYRNNFIYIS